MAARSITSILLVSTIFLLVTLSHVAEVIGCSLSYPLK